MNETDFWKAWVKRGISTVAEAEQLLNHLHLIGRKVKRMRFVGLCYDLTDEGIEDYVYNSLSKDMDEADRQEKSNFENIDDSVKIERSAEVDEPLLIEFEDGNRLEICTIMSHNFILSKNYIPWDIEAYINLPNIDANVLFFPLLSATITSVDIVPNDVAPNTVSGIVLWFDNGLGLHFYDCCFEDCLDYCHINLISKNNEQTYITFGELKKGMY